MTLRLFLAIPIPEAAAERLMSLESEVPGASWRTIEQLHLTLRFIGEVNEAVARDKRLPIPSPSDFHRDDDEDDAE